MGRTGHGRQDWDNRAGRTGKGGHCRERQGGHGKEERGIGQEGHGRWDRAGSKDQVCQGREDV